MELGEWADSLANSDERQGGELCMDDMFVQRSYSLFLNVNLTAVGEERKAEMIACAE